MTTAMEETDAEKRDFNSDDDDDDDDDNHDQIIINVGGIRHETKVATLTGKTGTRLSRLAERHILRNNKEGKEEGGVEKKGTRRRKEYFFDRHPIVFTSIIDFYRNGELHVPLDVCGAVVKRELDYWHLDETLIEPCCWTSYSQFIENQKTLTEFNLSIEQENDIIEEFKNAKKGWRRYMMHTWMVLDHPRYSKVAMGYAVTSFAFVLASITGFCVETLPVMSTLRNVTRECWYTNVVSTTEIRVPHFFLECLDYVCTVFFTLELIVRIIFAPCKKVFFRSLMNIIDILALLPLYVQFLLEFLDWQKCLRSHRAMVELIFILRIIRIFRIFHLVKHYKALKILVHAIRASIQELLMLSIFLFIAMLVFSTVIFYAERPALYSRTSTGRFQTIPTGFWYSIITMTTVGYGDVYPETTFGCIVGALCALCGVLLVALTIPVISNNFALFYMHSRTRDEITRKDEDEYCEGVLENLREQAGGGGDDGRQMEEGSHRRKSNLRPASQRSSRHRQLTHKASVPSGHGLGTNRKRLSVKKRVVVSQDSGSVTEESRIITKTVEDSPAK